MFKKFLSKGAISTEDKPKTRAEMDKRYETPRPTGEFHSLGNLVLTNQVERGVQARCEKGSLSILFMTPHMIQVRVRPDSNFPNAFSYAIAEDFKPEPVSIKVEESTAQVRIHNGQITCEIVRQGSRLHIKLGEQAVVIGDALEWRGDEIRWTRQLPPDETCHGLGQRAYGLNLKGKHWQLWNADPHGYQRGTDPTYYSIPFYFGLHPQYALGIFWDNPARGSVDLGAANPAQMRFHAEAGELHFYVMIHKDPAVVLQQYMQLTGKPPLPPLWAFGYHQSRWGYLNSAKFREIAQEYRQRQLPCDTLHFDIDYMDGYRLFTYDHKTFPDLPQLVQELKEQGFKSIAILDPAIKVDDEYSVYNEGKKKVAFLTYPDGQIFTGDVWAGESVFPDFTNPEARAWWAKHVAELLKEIPFDGLWNDMNEPVVFMPKVAGSIPDYVPAWWDGHGAKTQVNGAHNTYGMQMARATRMGIEQARPDQRPFTLTRSTYAGGQRYSTSWTGDNHATWDHLRLSVSMLLNLGLSGMYFTGPDIGGFFETPSPELYARWIQLGSLLPFARTHSHKDSPDQEPWRYGPEIETIAREALNLRYQLLPYLYSSYAQSCQEGLPFIRPTFLNDRNDPLLYEQDDVFMIGDMILVAPVLEEGRVVKEFYLPRGVWYNFWTHRLIDGARIVKAEAPLKRIPIFVKAGATIPHWEPQQYIGEKPLDELQLTAYAGVRETHIYEDAGEGLAYQKGEFRNSTFKCGFIKNGFSLDWKTQGSYEPPYKRVRVELVGISAEPESVLVDDQPAPMWFFENGVLEVLTVPFKQLHIVGKSESSDQTVVSRPKTLEFD